MSEGQFHGDTHTVTAALCCEGCGRPYETNHGELTVGVNDVSYRGTTFRLTLRQAEVFRFMAKRFGQTVHRDRLLADLYGLGGEVEPKIMDVMICKIRQRIKASGAPLQINTIWGVGFQLLALNV